MKSAYTILVCAFWLCAASPEAQAQYLFKFLFKGTAYQTNGTGNVIQTPITERTLLQDRAIRGGITDLSKVAIVYHIAGDQKGDTVEIVDAASGAALAFQFGLWFGADPSLDRSAITNAAGTEARRIDYIYTTESSTYTSPSGHSVGAAFVTKRFLKDANGNVHTTIEGPFHWMVNPQGTNGTIVCSGVFTTGAPF